MTTTTAQPIAASNAPVSANTARPVRPFYWSVRRELWEHRSLYLAPVIVACVLLLASVLVALNPPAMTVMFDTFSSDKQRAYAAVPYEIVAIILTMSAMAVGLFYCLDALNGERRDRSVLFWKSMPVSDRTAVLAKLAVPMIAVPAILFVLITATHLAVLVIHLLLWAGKGLSVGNLLQRLPLLDTPLGVAYMVATLAIWYAPIYAWSLLVSAWAQRSPLAWAVVPWITIAFIEKLVLQTSHVAKGLGNRFLGGFDAGFSARESLMDAPNRLPQQGASSVNIFTEFAPDVLRFLSNPDVWLGIAIAAAMIAATIWLRRRQESQAT